MPPGRLLTIVKPLPRILVGQFNVMPDFRCCLFEKNDDGDRVHLMQEKDDPNM
jgi:hypothetical protein